MRRIATCETLHGTRDGQLMIDARLARDYALTERESACATLLKSGLAIQAIAERLEISPSTAEKHLVSLRRKLDVGSTLEAAIKLIRLEDHDTPRMPDAFPPVLTACDPNAIAGTSPATQNGDGDLMDRLASATSLDGMLDGLREASCDEGVGALFYFFLPLSAASFRKQDVYRCHAGPGRLVDAFIRPDGPTQLRIAARLFAEPDRALVIDLATDAGKIVDPCVVETCLRAGLDRAMTVGSPFGAGYVALTAFFRRSTRTGDACCPMDSATLRARLLLLQNVAFSLGTLAREAGLTLRERDVLAAVASGRSIRSVASQMSSGERAVGQLLKSARDKLGADTTAEAIAKAMALNALVFL